MMSPATTVCLLTAALICTSCSPEVTVAEHDLRLQVQAPVEDVYEIIRSTLEPQGFAFDELQHRTATGHGAVESRSVAVRLVYSGDDSEVFAIGSETAYLEVIQERIMSALGDREVPFKPIGLLRLKWLRDRDMNIADLHDFEHPIEVNR